MIVRDEERFLDACLRSVRGIVDEIVVADTGSTDATVSIANRHGAKVVRHVWNDDFSAARNCSLAAATGDYVLVLDADERLVAETATQLRQAVDRGGWDLAFLPFVNIGDDGQPCGRQWEAPRVYRRTPGLRYIGRIHEQMLQPLDSVRATSIASTVTHYGYQTEVHGAKNKANRNRKLLEKALDDPEANDPILRTNYLYHWANLANGRELIERFASFSSYVTQQWGDEPPRLPWVTGGLAEYCRLLNDVHRYEEAAGLARKLLERHGECPLLRYVLARADAASGRTSEAEAELRIALESPPRISAEHRRYTLDIPLIQSRSRYLMGLIRESQGRMSEAEEFYRAAWSEEPEQEAYLRSLLCAQVRMAQYQDAATTLGKHPGIGSGLEPSLDCLGLALSLFNQSAGGLAFWGERVKLSAAKFPPAQRMLDRLGQMGSNQRFSIQDFPEIAEALTASPGLSNARFPQTARKSAAKQG
jgi:tetratricopeptide (TPR) repeat protein